VCGECTHAGPECSLRCRGLCRLPPCCPPPPTATAAVSTELGGRLLEAEEAALEAGIDIEALITNQAGGAQGEDEGEEEAEEDVPEFGPTESTYQHAEAMVSRTCTGFSFGSAFSLLFSGDN
jgi:hypothetical protein